MAWRFFTAGGVAKTGEYVELAANAVTSAKILDGTIVNDDIDDGTITNAKLATPGIVVQRVNTQTGAVATGTTVMPIDDTIPQITEGDQYMSLAITPKNALNVLVINVTWYGSINVGGTILMGLFVGSTANALAAVAVAPGAANYNDSLLLQHSVVAGTTAGLTFRVRVGTNSAATTIFNGRVSATRIFGGVSASSITITEFTP